MNVSSLRLRLLGAGLLVAALTACGGGGSSTTSGTSTGDTPTGGTPTGGTPPGGTPPGGTAPTTTVCVDGASYQCSGDTIIRTDNGVAMTSNGVQAYARSTSDLETPIVEMTSAFGFQPTSGGVAEVRLSKDANSVVSSPALLLRDLGLLWDGSSERPLIIETFNPTQGRVQLAANGALSFGPLPPTSDLAFYDFGTLGPAGTQANYANNRYFPRTGNPSRCPAGVTPCAETETAGPGAVSSGNWRSGGVLPDWIGAGRLHGDGDVHAGDDPSGNPLPGGTGPGVPFPGSKGYRTFANWNYRYSNLSTWTTQDTVLIEEWALMGNEHNKNRRGIVTFGDITAPATVPAGGSATYSGIVYGWYGANASGEPDVFSGNVTVTVNFATRAAVVAISNTRTYDSSETPVPATLSATTTAGAAGTDLANYMTGAASSGSMTGGVSGRYFGPVVTSGTSGAGPAELGGTVSMTNTATGQSVVAGFIALKQ